MRIEDAARLDPGYKVVSPHTAPPYRPMVVHTIRFNAKRTRCLITVRVGEEFRTFPFEMVHFPPAGTRWDPTCLAWCTLAGDVVLPLPNVAQADGATL